MSANVSSHQIIKSLQKVHVQTCASEASNPSRSTLACWFDISRWHLTIICVSLLRDELSTTANLLICRRRHRLVMNCWRLLLDPSISQLLIQLGGKIALFSAEVNDECGTFTHCIFQCLPWGKKPWWNFLLTLQMFNERAATAAGCPVLMTWWHKTHVCSLALQQLGMFSTKSRVYFYLFIYVF